MTPTTQIHRRTEAGYKLRMKTVIPIRLHIIGMLAAGTMCLMPLKIARGAGLTIITHGYNSEATGGWVHNMTLAINQREGGNTTVYPLIVSAPAQPNGALEVRIGNRLGFAPSDSRTGEIVLEFDWSDVDGLDPLKPFDPFKQANTFQVAEAAVAWITSVVFQGLNAPVVELPIHLIGHSRGGSLVCELAKLLGERGIWIDQLTTLDAHPVCSDAPVGVYSNVIFADNYYQRLFGLTGCLAPFPSGLTIDGAANRELLALEGEGYINEHSDVHLWYHGTIDLNTPASDGVATIDPHIRSTWYLPTDEQGRKIGYHFSRIAGGHRPQHGIGWHHGGQGQRIPMSGGGRPQWPNIVLKNRDGKYTNQAGSQIEIGFRYSDTDSSGTIIFATDNDRNPYNGPPGIQIGSASYSATQSGVIETKVLRWATSTTHNGRYLYAKITDTNGNTRYDYLPKAFTITPGPPQPDVLPPTTRGNDLARSTAYRWDDRDGDGDGVPEAGETVGLQIRLRNVSTSVIRNIRAMLSSSLGSVQVIDAEATYDQLLSGEAAYSEDNFDLKFNFFAITSVPLRLRAEYLKDDVEFFQEWDFSLSILPDGALAPRLVVDRVAIDDSPPNAGDGDGIVESGENPDFQICLKNIGTANAIEVRARVTDVRIVSVRDETRPYPNLNVEDAAQCPSSGDFDLDDEIPKSFAGRITGNIVVIHSGTDQEQIIGDYTLFDVKPTPWIKVSPERYAFGVASKTQNIIQTCAIRNIGSGDMRVTALTTSATDTTWEGDPLPWTIPPGGQKVVSITIQTANLQGKIVRELVVTSDARIDDPGEDDRIVITGSVGESIPVYSVAGASPAGEIDTDGNFIVWQEPGPANLDIYGFDLRRGLQFPIATNAVREERCRISDGLVVWHDRRNWDGVGHPKNDVYAYDLRTRQEIVIAATPTDERVVGVDSNKVVFIRGYFEFTERSDQDFAYNLFVYDRQSGATSQLTAYTPNSSHSPISTVDFGEFDFGDDTIVWRDSLLAWQAGDNPPEWEFDSSQNRLMVLRIGVDSQPIVAVNSGGSRLSADDGRFVWRNTSGEYDQVWMWDSGTLRQITFDQIHHSRELLAISDNLIFYDKRNQTNLFYWNLELGQESSLVQSTGRCEDARMHSQVAAWRSLDSESNSHMHYAFINRPDLAVLAENISFSKNSPTEGEVVTVSVAVQNLTRFPVTNSVTLRLYRGDPDAGGTQVGTDAVLADGVPGLSVVQTSFSEVSIASEGTNRFFLRVTTPELEAASNNTTSKDVLALDSDLTGPELFSHEFTEHEGNGNGVVEPGEGVRFSFQLVDPSGIGDTELFVDGAATSVSPLSSSYSAISSALAAGEHRFEIRATDKDMSPAASANVVLLVLRTSQTVAITSPPSGTTYTTAQTSVISAMISDTSDIVRVDFYDGGNLKGTDTTPPYAHEWSVTSAENGSHIWTARAYSTSIVSTSAPVVLTVAIESDDLIVHYPLGSDAEDISPRALHGTLFGVQFGSETGRPAAKFDGLGAYVGLPPEAINNLVSGSITVWVWLRSDVEATITAKQHDQQNSYALLTIGYRPHTAERPVGTLSFHAHNDAPRALSSAVVSTQVWQHVAVTFSSAGVKFYIDGTNQGTITGNFSVPDILGTVNSVGAWIVNSVPIFPFNGFMHDLRVYSRELNETEILASVRERPPKVQITNVRIQPTTGLVFTVSGVPAGYGLLVQKAISIGEWTDVQRFDLATDPQEFSEPVPPGSTQAFYRVNLIVP